MKPEQSNPLFVVPPHTYFVPITLLAEFINSLALKPLPVEGFDVLLDELLEPLFDELLLLLASPLTVSLSPICKISDVLMPLSEAILFAVVPCALAIFDNVDRKSTRLNSSHVAISYAVVCL